MENQETKICSKCGQEKPLSDFYKEPRHKDGVHSCCKICFCKSTKDYKRRNHQKVLSSTKNLHLKKTFGITLDEYKTMLLKQKGVCAICGKPETSTFRGKIRHLSVDHDHETDKNRGLLCNDCNIALGWFHDDVQILANAIRYLDSWSDGFQ